ncbi:MAG: oligosaccharide flippase family protein, partial [Nitrospinae bacterium]|nr:oligosaccharide flippase family protein [Nitrospinota bacterium]
MLKDLLKLKLTKNILLVSSGNIFAAGLGFITLLIITHYLSVEKFGFFNIGITTIFVVSIIADMGVDISVIKFISSSLGKNMEEEAKKFFHLGLFIKVITSLFAAFVLFLTADMVAIFFFNERSLSIILKISAIGIVLRSIYMYIKSVLYAYEFFKASVIQQLFIDIFKLLLVIVSVYALTFGTELALGIFALSPIIGIFIGYLYLSRVVSFSLWKGQFTEIKELFSYSKWIYLGSICDAMFYYSAIYLLTFMLSSEAVGVYSLAMN